MAAGAFEPSCVVFHKRMDRTATMPIAGGEICAGLIKRRTGEGGIDALGARAVREPVIARRSRAHSRDMDCEYNRRAGLAPSAHYITNLKQKPIYARSVAYALQIVYAQIFQIALSK